MNKIKGIAKVEYIQLQSDGKRTLIKLVADINPEGERSTADLVTGDIETTRKAYLLKVNDYIDYAGCLVILNKLSGDKAVITLTDIAKRYMPTESDFAVGTDYKIEERE